MRLASTLQSQRCKVTPHMAAESCAFRRPHAGCVAGRPEPGLGPSAVFDTEVLAYPMIAQTMGIIANGMKACMMVDTTFLC
jgi:hypothetical protein